MLRGIYRYPIKGLSAQPLESVRIEAGRPLPFDRVFALTRPGSAQDPEAPRWRKKGYFLMLMLDDVLARVHTRLDVPSLQLTVLAAPLRHASGGILLQADLSQPSGRAQAAQFFGEQVPGLKGTPELVHLPDGHFMDKPDNVLSCINLNTVRQLERLWGTPVDPLRFRANFYIDGLAPFEEFTWVGQSILIGGVELTVDRRNGRCGATNVNPSSGERDMDIPRALRQSFGHKDVGVYLVAKSSGTVRVGDGIHLVTAPFAEQSSGPAPQVLRGSHICGGCYYIFDPARGAPGVPAGTSFERVDSDWRCPDCGTDKEIFRPYETA